MRYFIFEIEYNTTEDRKDYILNYMDTTLYENATEVKDITSWIFENVGRSYADYINFVTVEDDEDNIKEIYYITEDGQLDLISYDEEEKETYTFSVNLPKEDYEILNHYDFYFEKNISEYLQQIAREFKR